MLFARVSNTAGFGRLVEQYLHYNHKLPLQLNETPVIVAVAVALVVGTMWLDLSIQQQPNRHSRLEHLVENC